MKRLSRVLTALLAVAILSASQAMAGVNLTPSLKPSPTPAPTVAPTPTPTPRTNTVVPDPTLKIGTGDYVLKLDTTMDGAVYSTGLPVFYTYGPATAGTTEATGGRKARLILTPSNPNLRILSVKGYCESGNLSVSPKRNTGSAADPSVVTLMGVAPVKTTALQKYTVTLDLEMATYNGSAYVDKKYMTLTLQNEAGAAYSRVRILEDESQLTVNEQQGSIITLSGYYPTGARIRTEEVVVQIANTYTSQRTENFRVDTTSVPVVQNLFPNDIVRFYNFVGNPNLTASGESVDFPGSQDSKVYIYDEKTKTLKYQSSSYVNGFVRLSGVKQLGWYCVTEGTPVNKK